MTRLRCGPKALDLSEPVVMGIVNATPDSFSDGGALYDGGRLRLDVALGCARAMSEAGAKIIDVGGESTRPGADPVTLQEELDRVLPVVDLIARELDVVVSVDTSSPEVMRGAAALGAGMINDVRALQREGALEAAAASGLSVCLMHMQGTPQTMQQQPIYDDVLTGVERFFTDRVDEVVSGGVPLERIILDPGFGFGKTAQHNLVLLRRMAELAKFGCPLLAGLSRKSVIGQVLGRGVQERLPASLALAMLAVQAGASIVRVHDVPETVDVLRMVAAVASA